MPQSKQPATKTVHALSSPYSDPLWYMVLHTYRHEQALMLHRPIVSTELENAILDILVPLLLPIGQYRDQYVKSTKSQKRKRKGTIKTYEGHGKSISEDDIWRTPDAHKDLTVGFNSTVRHLELLSQTQKVQGLSQHVQSADTSSPLLAVFVCKSALPDVMTSPLPLLAATASLALPPEAAIRLLPISQSGASRIAEAMKQPRVNVLGLLSNSAGAADELQSLIFQKISAIDVPWIREAAENRYCPVKIHTKETTVGDQAKDSKRKKEEE